MEARIAAAYEGGRDRVVEALRARRGLLGATDMIFASSSFSDAGGPRLEARDCPEVCINGILLVRVVRAADPSSIDSESFALFRYLMVPLRRKKQKTNPPIRTTTRAVAAAAIPMTAGFVVPSSLLTITPPKLFKMCKLLNVILYRYVPRSWWPQSWFCHPLSSLVLNNLRPQIRKSSQQKFTNTGSITTIRCRCDSRCETRSSSLLMAIDVERLIAVNE